MKINLLLPLALVLALLPLSGSWAYHPGAQSQNAPLPVKKCFSGIELYRQLFVSRAAGLTLEEAQTDNGFTIRIIKFMADRNSVEFDEDIITQLDAKTVEVYELPDPQYLDPEWQSDWATAKFDACVAAIPPESMLPPELLEFMNPQEDTPDFMVPLEPEELLEPEESPTDQIQLQRMVPEKSI